MRIELSRFSLHAPDVILSDWFISADFAGLLGLEYSRDAAKQLRELLAGTRTGLDYEADEVTLRFRSGKKVVAALRQLYSGLGWDARELDAAEPDILAYRRPRPLPVALGDVFTVPIVPDRCGVGQVIDLQHDSPTVAIMRWLGSAPEAAGVKIASLKPLTILHTLGPALRTGEWPIIGNQPVTLDPASGPGGRQYTVGAKSYGGDGPVPELLRAYAGLAAWDQGFYDPEYLRKLVMGQDGITSQ
ncbi:MAG: hypothetical protein AB7L66_05130 [Gemmatimonadales bacterium]